MPQNNVLPDWRVTYPNDAPAQKPGGVTVATTATAPRVPNKHTYSAGTIQIASMEALEEPPKIIEPTEDETVEVEEPVEEESEDEEEEPSPPTRGKPRRR
jgi:hypothetical protein